VKAALICTLKSLNDILVGPIV